MAKQDNYEKNKHLIGQKFNKWTILDIVIHDNKHHTYALARCECGTEKEVRLTYVTSGRMKDCGCGRRERLNEALIKKYEHLIGSQINGWTVLEIIPPHDNKAKTHFKCVCRCGNVRDVQITNLLSGKSTDCGCGRKETMREIRTNNLVGRRFGKLVVVEKLDERNKFNRIMYRCKCDCGNEAIVSSNCLANGHTNSCGCLLSYWNLYIKNFLDKQNIENKQEYTIHLDDNYYRFDFYLPDYNLFIEYDGRQHYEPVKFYKQTDEEAKENLAKTQEHDAAKNKYCEDNNINLLRIPYWETKNIETIISNHLQRLSEKGLAA